MTQRYFISYSRLDQQVAERLYKALTTSVPPIPVFMDIYDIKPGQEYDEVLEEAAKSCTAMLFLMSGDSTAKGSQCRIEWGLALRRRRPVIPIKVEAEVEPPMDFVRCQWVDLSQSFDLGLQKLQTHLRWLNTSEGQLDHQRTLIALAERDWRRATSDQDRARVQFEIDRLREEITRLEHILEDGPVAENRVADSIARAIERERQELAAASPDRTKFINPSPGLAPAHFQDRIDETRFVAGFLRDPTQRLLTIVGRGGVGKTAVVCRLLKSIESGMFPDDLGTFDCDGIVYLSGAGSHKVTDPNIFQDLSRLLPKDKAGPLQKLYEKAEVSLREKTLALLDAFPHGCTVLLLDNFEDVVNPESRRISNDALRELISTFLTAPHHGVKVVLTTRVGPVDFATTQPARQTLREIGAGLPSPYAENILRQMDADGSLGLKDATDDVLATLREQTGGYPKALEALVGWLKSDRETTLLEILERAGGCLPGEVVEAFVGEAFSRLDPRDQQVMQALAVYGRPVTASAIDYMLQPWTPVVDSARVLNRLANMFFVRKEAGRYFLHPLDAEHALKCLAEASIFAHASGQCFDLRNLRLRGADYLRQIRKPADQWKSLDDILPQLHEFDLRFSAGDFEQAWQILSLIGFHYLRAWGHYRMQSDMTAKLVEPLTGTPLQTSVIGNLGICHRNLGEAREAVRCFEKCLELVRDPRSGIPDTGEEAVWLSNLGATLDILGETSRSIACHERALEIDRLRRDLDGMAIDLHNLAGRFGELGQTERGLQLCGQSIDIARQLRHHNENGFRFKEALRLTTMARLLMDAQRPDEAIQTARLALEVAEAQHSPEICILAWHLMGLGLLMSGSNAAAVAALDKATEFDFPRLNDGALAAQGLGRLITGDTRTARDCFETVLANTERKLNHCADHYTALGDQAMARAGLIACDEASQVEPALFLLRKLHGQNPDGKGFARRRKCWLECAARADKQGLLKPVLDAANAS